MEVLRRWMRPNRTFERVITIEAIIRLRL